MCMSYPYWPDFPKPIMDLYEPNWVFYPAINVYLKGGACSQAKPKMHPMLMVN